MRDVWRIILTNHRTPRNSWADLHAMIGALGVGERRLRELYARYGSARLKSIGEELLAYSEVRMRREIARIPDGLYEAQDFIEDDGVVADRSYRMFVRVIVDGSEIIFDFRESDRQATGPCNMTLGVTLSAAYNAVLHLTDPQIPRNAGCYRPIRVLTRPGTVMNVTPPAPEVGGNSEIHGRVVDMIFAALAEALPERVAAPSGSSSVNFLFGGVHPRTREVYTNYHLEGSGWGGRAKADGNNVQCPINGNCRNTPVEVFETRYPWLTRSLRLVPDSGGAGKFRGGLASERVLELRAPSIVVSEFADRTHTRAWGLFGGKEGASGKTMMRRSGDEHFATVRELFGTASDTKYSGLVLHEGDQVLIRTAGGGGYGDPAERDRDRVASDVAEGFVTATAAKEEYGFEH